MSLRAVKMSSEVWTTCLTHALTTETEEIMGLLLGDIIITTTTTTTTTQDNISRGDDGGGGGAVALIWGASPQMRCDRRKDRVETNPELLAAASAQAERMTLATGRTTRVIGWYHSHPHITVLPSHVDVRTQAMYQLLDPGFIGLIFSCFSEDAHKIGRIQVIAFQSLDGKDREVHAPPAPHNPVIQVESSWSSSDNALSMSGSTFTESLDQDTGDSRLAKASKVGGKSSILEESFSDSDVNNLVKQRTRGNSLNAESVRSAAIEMDASDMSPSMQEALHLSNIEMRGAEYVRKEVPLEVLPTRSLLKLDCPLTSFTEMQHILFEEERSAYNQALLQNIRNGEIHPLTFIHHTSTYQASLCKLMEYCLSPAVNALHDRLKENETRLARLMEEANSLESEAAGRESERGLGSPRHRPTNGFRGNLVMGQRDVHSPSDSRSSSGIGSRRKAY